MLKFHNNDTTIIATFEDFILTTYVIIDDLYQCFAPLEVKNRRHVLDAKLSDSEIITIALWLSAFDNRSDLECPLS